MNAPAETEASEDDSVYRIPDGNGPAGAEESVDDSVRAVPTIEIMRQQKLR